MTPSTNSAEGVGATIGAVRAFNRFYTRTIGVLGDHLLDSPYSLTEMRVLYELAHRSTPTAAELGRDLGLDAGYLSRILRRFERLGLVARSASRADARRSHLRLTPRGRATFTPLDRRAKLEVAALLHPLSASAQRELVAAMDTIQNVLGTPSSSGKSPTTPSNSKAAYTLRPHQAGDMGWVVQRHGALYWDEWRYNAEFEALVARIVADFLDHLDPARERCWIAERGGERIGSVFLVSHSKTVAKLRLLLVDPAARGLGLGRRLVEECIGFARTAGYRKITLWTQSELTAARRIYKATGFKRVDSQPNDAFGRRGLVSETWELELSR